MTLKEIQLALTKLKFGTLVGDGKMGPKTKAAIKLFQKAYGLVIDGIPGAKTVAAIGKALAQTIVPVATTTEIEPVSLARIKNAHPLLVNEIIDLVKKANNQLTGRSQVRIVFTTRTFAEQAHLFALGKTKVNPDGRTASKPMGNKVTNAKPGQSYHNYGLAVDFCLLIDGKEISWNDKLDWDGDKLSDWMEVVKVFRDAGWEWGGLWKFRDAPHFQKTFGLNWKTLLARYNAGQFIPGTTFVKI